MSLETLKKWEESNQEFNRLHDEIEVIEQELKVFGGRDLSAENRRSNLDFEIRNHRLQARLDEAWSIICNVRADVKILRAEVED